MLKRFFVMAFSIALLCTSAVFADDLQDMAKNLSAPEFATRQKASKGLTEAGIEAMPVLKDAATGTSREASIRAIEILQAHLQGADAKLKEAAEKTLKEISESDNAVAAKRAQKSLEAVKQANANQANNPFGNRIAGNVQIRIVGGQGAQRIQIQNNNGAKKIQVEEDGKKIKIETEAGGKIKMEITEKKDGKETTKKFEAKNADDLKKQDAEAHKIFEKYNKQNNIQIQGIRGIQIGPGGIQGVPQIVPPQKIRRMIPKIIRPEQGKEIVDKLKKTQSDLEAAKEKLKKAAEQAADKEGLQKAIDGLQEANDRLEELKKTFEG